MSINIKKLAKSKAVWVVGGLALGGLFLLSRRSGGAVPEVPYTSDPGGVGSIGVGDGGGSSGSNDLDAFRSEMANMASSFASLYAGQDASFRSQLEALQSSYESQLASMSHDLQLYSAAAIANYVTAPEPTTVKVGYKTAESPVAGAGVGIVGGMLQGIQQAMQPSASVTTKTQATSGLALDIGVGGIDYNTATAAQKRQLEEQQRLIDSNPSARQAAIDRALGVYQARKALGIDTSEQEKYIRVNLKAGDLLDKAG